MVYKSIGYGMGDTAPRTPPRQNPRVEGSLIAVVGDTSSGRPSRNAAREHVERITLDDAVLGYNASGGMVLVRYTRNDRGFDQYLGLPFTKGVTERDTGRTMLILGSSAHHGEAMLGQFSGTLWDDADKSYGDSIRWINAGDRRTGFIGLDYRPAVPANAGVANTPADVQFLARTLQSFGFDPEKQLFLLEPPYIRESAQGKTNRTQGLVTLRDYAR